MDDGTLPRGDYRIKVMETTIKYRGLPVVALAGKPNVGKSTLFNRLLHRRRAITGPTPGVTRDPVEADAFIAGKPLRLIDTGGFKLDQGTASRPPAAEIASTSLDSAVLAKTLETLGRADLIVLLLEAGEVSAEDQELIGIVRRYQDKLLVAVNKTEGGRREAESWNLLSYGFDKLYLISAEHGDNIVQLEEAIVSRLDFSRVVSEDPENRPIRIALLGKPNTGKSTLSNRLTDSAASIVSEIPGTTRDVVEGAFAWKNRDFLVLDTAGIRRKAKVRENIEYYSVNRAIKSIDDADIVFLLIDAAEGLSDQDKKIAALAYDQGRGIILILNKWDTMPAVKNSFQAACDRIHFFFGQLEFAPIVALSARDGDGIDTLLNTALKMYRQLNTQVETSKLNQALERWLQEYPPPSAPRTRFKVRYAVQKSANPAVFIFFVSRPQAVGEPYVAYLRNKIRADLGFSLVPVTVEVRGSAGSGETGH
ncbi:MAG: ribosome biogenesis GTPase Der [Treponema sp.]|jgi:GTP-binding protein|nr:ribosome biogenesis GTPase Der [Treponema sp.]